MEEKILVLDFGGQYDQLIARRVREQRVFAEIRRYDGITPGEIAEEGYKGVILTGGPESVYSPAAPRCEAALFKLGIPVLGICYGAQLMAWLEGGEAAPSGHGGEYGKTVLHCIESPLFKAVPAESLCWMSHTDFIKRLPESFRVTARTEGCSCAAMENEGRRLYGVQFHPEVTHTAFGKQIIGNFLFEICGCKGDWRMEDFAQNWIGRFRAGLQGKRILLALSGGVDSSVAAALLHRAAGDSLICVFVDHGLLRKGEAGEVGKAFGGMGLRLIRVNAAGRFLRRLSGVSEPEHKRRVIGEEFIRVFEDEAKKLGKIDILAQGTIYPDVVESGGGGSAVIKSHHNVGGLPDVISFERIVEPLRELFKDEVRELGEKLGLPRELIRRQPFPGPGLAVRVMGEVTAERLELLREADAIFREEVERAGSPAGASQYFAVLTGQRSVGVMGDARTYGYTVALRSVVTDDFMTAEWARLPYELLERASSRITNEVKGITRVVYDITSKPPATVEWE